MALTDIVSDEANSARAARGNTGTLVDSLSDKGSGLVSPTFYGGYWSVTETFKNSSDINLPNGTLVTAFHSTTHLRVGSGTITGGVATFQVTTDDQVYLVVNPGASGLSGETVCTTLITPS